MRSPSQSTLCSLTLIANLCGCAYDWSGEWKGKDVGAVDSAPTADASCVPSAEVGTAQCAPRPGVPGTWCTIPAGSFIMGQKEEEHCRGLEIERCVTLTRRFEISQTEVTQAQFATLMGFNPSFFSSTGTSKRSCGEAGCGDNPVERVTWDEAAAYCNALSRRQKLTPCYWCICGSYGDGEVTTCKGADICINGTCRAHDGQSNPCAGVGCPGDAEICAMGSCEPRPTNRIGSPWTFYCSVAPDYRHGRIYSCPGYRLPTDAEFEYAYRAGTITAFHNGKEIFEEYGTQAGEMDCVTTPDSNLGAIAWYKHNSGLRTHAVGGRGANRWGLRDMAGNVYEHIHERYQYAISDLDAVDPFGFTVGDFYLVRGGSYASSPFGCRSSSRNRFDASGSNRDYQEEIGFRCVRGL